MRIALGTPNTGAILPWTVGSLINTVYRSEHEIVFIGRSNCYVFESRNETVKMARDEGCSHLFFVDADMWFEKGTLERLIAHEKEIVGAAYNARKFPLISTVKLADEAGNFLEVAEADFPKELFRCAAVATGCMLIRLDIFDRLPKPWFFHEWADRPEDSTGDDVWFCNLARAHGIDVWCDPTITVKHMGYFPY